MFSKGIKSMTFSEFRNSVDDLQLLSKYFGIERIPILINSPFRQDRNPSFALFFDSNGKIRFKDFSNQETGDVFAMLGKLWNKSYNDVLKTLIKNEGSSCYVTNTSIGKRKNTSTRIEVKVRKWLKHDLNYWKSYGITVEWLKLAEIYPISHIFFITDEKTDVINAEKYAYVYIERRNGLIYKKIYQPLCKDKRRKWFSKMNGGIISLWTKIPENGEKLFICSSLKDALCLWVNTNIPCISLQGEGYYMEEDTINELKGRFKDIYILYDNDNAGIEDSKKLQEKTGFKNIVLPAFDFGKDVSDYYKGLEDKSEFNKTIFNLLQQTN